MESIIKNGYERIMHLFYTDKKTKIHLRDIARKAKMNENSASIFLNQLRKDNILKAEKDGNLKKYSINKNNQVYLIFSIFDILKYEKLESKRKNAISFFLNKLQEKPLIAVLFGSTAKENHDEKSDIDLLLIVNKKIKTEKAENYSEAQTGIKISCFQITYNSFLQELKTKSDNLIQSAINTGYPILNNLNYYSLCYNED